MSLVLKEMYARGIGQSLPNWDCRRSSCHEWKGKQRSPSRERAGSGLAAVRGIANGKRQRVWGFTRPNRKFSQAQECIRSADREAKGLPLSVLTVINAERSSGYAANRD